jgi:hypothetical protein
LHLGDQSRYAEAERGPHLCPAHGMVLVTACACDQMCASVSTFAFALALVNSRHALRDVATAWYLLAMLGGRSTVVHVRLLANVHHH